MNPDADNTRQSNLPAMPSEEFIIESLASQFPNDVKLSDGQVGKVRFVRASPSHDVLFNGDHEFLKKHILLEITVDSHVFSRNRKTLFGSNGTIGLYAYDGHRLMSFDGPNCNTTLSEVLRAEAMPLDQIDPHQLARFFNEILVGTSQIVLQCSAYAQPESGHGYDQTNSSLSKPSVTGNKKDGWSLHFWALRHRPRGCVSFQFPLLFEYIIAVSPQFEIRCTEINNDLETKYLAVFERGLHCGVPYANPKRKYDDKELSRLIVALQDDFIGTRADAIEAVRELNCLSKDKQSGAGLAIPDLIKCLHDKDKFDCVGYRYTALEDQIVGTLSQVLMALPRDQVGSLAKSVAPDLVPYLFDKHMRYTILLTLKHIRPDPGITDTIISAIRMLRERDPSEYGRDTVSGSCRYDADWIDLIELLGFADPPAESAIPFLEELVTSNADRVTKEKASEVLQKIRIELGIEKDAEAVAYHIRILTSDNEPDIRLNSLAALTYGDPPPEQYVRPVMISISSNSNPQRKAGPRLDPLPAEIWPAFMEFLSDPSDSVRMRTVRILTSLGRAARPLVKELLGFGKSPYFNGFKSSDGYGQNRFYKVIGEIDPDGTETIPLLQEALSDPSQLPAAIDLLLSIGSPQCREIVDSLEQPIVNSVAFSPDGLTLSAGFENSPIKLWNTASWQEMPTVSNDSISAHRLVFSPDGQILACGQFNNGLTIKMWNLLSREELSTTERLEGWGGVSLAFSPDGNTLAVASRYFAIKLWDVVSGNVSDLSLPARNHMSCAVAFSPDGQILASGGHDFDRLTYRPDGTVSQASGGADAIVLWRVASRQEIHTMSGGFGEVKSLFFSPDGRTIYSGSDGCIMLWDVASGVLKHTLRIAGTIKVVAFSPDGRTLATTDRDKSTIVLRDVASEQEIRTLSHPLGVMSLAFSPDGLLLASGGARGIRLWDLASGKEIRTLHHL